MSPDHLAELSAQAEVHLARLREATKAAHERLESGLLNAGAAARQIEPDPEPPAEAPRASLVDWDDPLYYEPEK